MLSQNLQRNTELIGYSQNEVFDLNVKSKFRRAEDVLCGLTSCTP